MRCSRTGAGGSERDSSDRGSSRPGSRGGVLAPRLADRRPAAWTVRAAHRAARRASGLDGHPARVLAGTVHRMDQRGGRIPAQDPARRRLHVPGRDTSGGGLDRVAARPPGRGPDLRLRRRRRAVAAVDDDRGARRGMGLVPARMAAVPARRRMRALPRAVRQVEALDDHPLGGAGGSAGGGRDRARARHPRGQVARVRAHPVAASERDAVAPPLLLPDPGGGVSSGSATRRGPSRPSCSRCRRWRA